MVLCTRCKKRPAVVFITTMHGNEKRNEGLCLVCAKELDIPQVAEYMEHMGITDEDIEQMSDQMMDMMEDESFQMGGASTLPNFIQKMFRESPDEDSDKPADGSEEKQKPEKTADHRPERPERLERSGKPSGKQKKQDDGKKELKYLDNYCTNLSRRAENGEMDGVIGRDKEISRVIQILSRRQKNNPCLIGEPGVGKTAIAEGIALRIASGNVPFHLKDKKIYLLDMTALVAGTQFRGQFESRVKGLVEEVKEQGNVILFIDEVHSLVGAGDSEGSMNAANILKPALSRGEVQVIGATTFSEYRKYIEKDGALERRFQPVRVDEPSVEDTVAILCGVAKYYESFHRVKISKEMLRLCAVLSERYITDRFLPDKAIDLLDESCAYVSIRHPELTEMEQLVTKIAEKEEQIEAIETDPNPDYQLLAERKGELIHLKARQEELNANPADVSVSAADLAHVIEIWTGIPANKIEETEYVRLRELESHLSARVIGQDEAIHALAGAIKRTRVQMSRRRRPASFIFVGPTGVGKTELVKVLSEELFDSPEPLIRLDMTEYMEKHAVSRMIGSPPGYVGYDEAGQLTEKVRRRPYSVILFDEIEKAHPDVMNLLLQILDEGRIDDAQGRSVNFENTVIVMTSNAGSTDKSTGVGFNRTEGEISRDKALKALKEFLRPEFVGRVDEIIVFRPLSVDDFAKIADLMLKETAEALSERGITLSWDDASLSWIAKEAHGKSYGARDIRRVLRQYVEDKIAGLIVDGETQPEVIRLTGSDDGVTVAGETASPASGEEA
ncbi:MAG: ATP-dependent Clp protease ATP-binding subunit [Oscillospiraceae bacterium]|nr:ATP-dependent Clp protease ATP-binding subunit [Oscillospiraceae bacterium]